MNYNFRNKKDNQFWKKSLPRNQDTGLIFNKKEHHTQLTMQLVSLKWFSNTSLSILGKQ